MAAELHYRRQWITAVFREEALKPAMLCWNPGSPPHTVLGPGAGLHKEYLRDCRQYVDCYQWRGEWELVPEHKSAVSLQIVSSADSVLFCFSKVRLSQWGKQWVDLHSSIICLFLCWLIGKSSQSSVLSGNNLGQVTYPLWGSVTLLVE